MRDRVLVTHADPRALAEAVAGRVGGPIPWCRLDDSGSGDATVWFCASSPPPAPVRLPRLRWIQSGFAGIEDWFGRPEWREGVLLTRSIADYPERIAQHVFGYLLARSLDVPLALRQMEARSWSRWTPGSLWGKRMLIVGVGAIGRRVASVGRALGLEIAGIRRRSPTAADRRRGIEGPDALPRRLAVSEIVVNLLPHTRETEAFWSTERFAALPAGATFLNLSRGATVDEDALRRGLDRGRPAFAMLDVARVEPVPADHWARGHKGVWLTPHVAGVATVGPLAADFAENWRRDRAGLRLANRVDRSRGY